MYFRERQERNERRRKDSCQVTTVGKLSTAEAVAGERLAASPFSLLTLWQSIKLSVRLELYKGRSVTFLLPLGDFQRLLCSAQLLAN